MDIQRTASVNRSAGRGFLDLPLEIRFMIYRLLFSPSTEPILIALAAWSSVKRSAQLLHACKTCADEASPILYGENHFALDWAYRGAEDLVLDFLERIGPTNRRFIRHLRARHHSIHTLPKIRARRSMRAMLENLESLSFEFFPVGEYGPATPIMVLKNARLCLKTQRGPYRKLVRVLNASTISSGFASTLCVRIVSAQVKPGPEEFDFDLEAEIKRLERRRATNAAGQH